MKNSETRKWWLPLLVAALVVFGIGGLAQAATLFVANNGQDGPACGSKSLPCRSISKAIEKASDGDKIVVGPGRYRDLDGDGNFNGPGEEAAEVGGCNCMINVDKQLTIESRDGAGATVLDAGGQGIEVVRIEANDVVFGMPKKGFTLSKGKDGLLTDGGTSGIKVAGNKAIANINSGFIFDGIGHELIGNLSSNNGSAGFFFSGNKHVLRGNRASNNDSEGFNFGGSEHELRDNLASNNDDSGFRFFGDRHVLRANQASDNVETGFRISGEGNELIGNLSSTNGFEGFSISGTDHVLKGNFASNNGMEGFFVVDDDNVLTGNLAIANGDNGFEFLGNGHELRGNATVGNKLHGIRLEAGSSATITKNNIYGNFIGLSNSSGTEIDARNNFWGAPSGPGPEPADAVFNHGGSSTTVAPFATKEFKVKTKVKPLRSEKAELEPNATEHDAPIAR